MVTKAQQEESMRHFYLSRYGAAPPALNRRRTLRALWQISGIAMMMLGCVAFILSVTVVLIPGAGAIVEWAGFHDVLIGVARVMCGISMGAASVGLLVISGWRIFTENCP